jgi:outer membrane protein OmpA-like peptidoglycan-associated protein
MRKVRSENIKEDAWVFVYKPEDIELDVQPEPTSANPATVDKPEPVPVPEPEPEPTSANPATVDKPEPEPEPEPETNPYEGMHPVFFNLHHGTSSDLVEGQIQVVDPDRTNVVNMLEANQWNYIDKPSNIHSEVLLVADLFGYRKINHAINLDEPEKDSTDYFIQVMNDSILVDFELVRYHRGDIFTMFNVYFFSHSSIMRPESVYELDQLLAMLNENPQLRIRLHGHTNGNSAGTMRYRPEDDHSLFTPSGSLEKTASAKTLSEERANVVKRYLIDKGVEPDRMEIKGWGGKRMLYKKTEEQAIKNVRVEVEIIEE